MTSSMLQITNKFLKNTLSVLTRTHRARYKAQVRVFKELIVGDAEDHDFVAGPVAYLKKRRVLPFDKVKLSDGSVVPLVNDAYLLSAVRRARQLYSEGRLNVRNSENEEKDVAFVESRTETTYPDRTKLITPEAYADESKELYLEGESLLGLGNALIGPLIRPELFEIVRKQVNTALKSETRKDRQE